MYIAQANIISGNLEVKKGELISEEEYETLPETLKIKFVKGKMPSSPKGFNKIIGDSVTEKTKRKQMARQMKAVKGKEQKKR